MVSRSQRVRRYRICLPELLGSILQQLGGIVPSHFITNKDSEWVGPANSHPTMYIEQIGLTPVIQNYWNAPGSVQKQERYFDNFVVSTNRIGDLRNPE